MSKAQAPTAPDPVATANAQTASNVNTAEAQTALNDVNQQTPYGSVTYNQTGTGAEGVPTYTETTALSPAGQTLFNNESGLENSALGAAQGLSQGITTTPINLNTADSSTLNETPQALNSNVANSVYNQESSFLAPQWQQQQQQLQDQLSQQGIGVGNQAYSNAENQFDNAQTQAYQSAADSAVEQGVNASSALDNEALQGQAQNVNQQVQAQDQPVNLLSALISGGQASGLTTAPNSTAAQTSVNPTNTSQITQNSYNDQLAAYQAQLAQQNSLWGGLSSLGGSLGAAAILAP